MVWVDVEEELMLSTVRSTRVSVHWIGINRVSIMDREDGGKRQNVESERGKAEVGWRFMS